MKIKELHELLKQKYKKYLSEIEEMPCYLGFGPAYKEFFITKKSLRIRILQVGKEKSFEFFIQDDGTGEGVTISNKMKAPKVIALVDLLL